MPRSRFQRTFLEWFRTNRSRFLHEVALERRDNEYIRMLISGAHGLLVATVSERNLNVAVTYEDEVWDVIFDMDIAPRKVKGGYVCDLCLPEYKMIFKDRPSLYIGHSFEPFLAWINDVLAKAKWLVLLGESGETTTAELSSKISVNEDYGRKTKLIPLQR